MVTVKVPVIENSKTFEISVKGVEERLLVTCVKEEIDSVIVIEVVGTDVGIVFDKKLAWGLIELLITCMGRELRKEWIAGLRRLFCQDKSSVPTIEEEIGGAFTMKFDIAEDEG